MPTARKRYKPNIIFWLNSLILCAIILLLYMLSITDFTYKFSHKLISNISPVPEPPEPTKAPSVTSVASQIYAIITPAITPTIDMSKLPSVQVSNVILPIGSNRGDANRKEEQEVFVKEKVIEAIAKHLHGVFRGKAQSIYLIAKTYHVNPLLISAIMKHETGNGTSAYCRNNNNVGGMFGNSGRILNFETIEDSITVMARLLRTHYIDKGLGDIESIGNKYCPISDERDTEGINKDWIPTVTYYYNEMLEYSQN